MTKYLSLLRGINVSGHRLIKMEKLREMFAALGVENVKTYIQSGNVIFDSAESKTDIVNKKVEEYLSETLGYEVVSVLRTASDLERIVKSAPFGEKVNDNNLKLYVVFLKEIPTDDHQAALISLNNDRDRFEIAGKEVYCSIDKRYQKHPFSNNFVEKVLKVAATTRNWRTVNKLLELTM